MLISHLLQGRHLKGIARKTSSTKDFVLWIPGGSKQRNFLNKSKPQKISQANFIHMSSHSLNPHLYFPCLSEHMQFSHCVTGGNSQSRKQKRSRVESADWWTAWRHSWHLPNNRNHITSTGWKKRHVCLYDARQQISPGVQLRLEPSTLPVKC